MSLIEDQNQTLNELKRHLRPKSRDLFDLNTYRILLIAGIFFYPAWTLFLRYLPPAGYDPLVFRLGIQGLLVGLLALSYFSEFVRKNIADAFIGISLLMTTHFFYLWHQNQLNEKYTSSLLIVVCALSACLPTRGAFALYTALCFGCTGIIAYYNSALLWYRPITIAGVLTILSVSYLALHGRLRRFYELAKSEKRFKTITEHLQVGVIFHDVKGQIYDVNPVGFKMLGFPPDKSTQGLKLEDLGTFLGQNGPSRLVSAQFMNLVIRNGSSLHNMIVGVRHSDMAIGWLQMNIDPLLDDDGKAWGYITSFIDITQRRLEYEQLGEARARSQHSAKLASLGEMAGGIAHEIDNPLMIIEGKINHLKTHMLERKQDPKFVLHALEVMESTAKRIANIVKGLRFFSRDGEKDPFTRISLKAIINNAMALCQERFKNHGIIIEGPEGVDEKLTIDCSGVQISQVLINLLSNAHDAVLEFEEKWILLEVIDQGAEVLIAVTDSGPGIKSELAQKIFQPFFTTKEIGKGTGLGLSICKGIMERHSGAISLNPRHSNTRFEVILPKRQLQKDSLKKIA